MNTDNTQHGAEPALASAGSRGAFGLEAAMRRIESGDIREADAVAVVKRLRECRSKTALWCDQLAKARLTDEEREAISTAAWHLESMAGGDLAGRVMTTLRALLERTK